jgi:hypothetical protein
LGTEVSSTWRSSEKENVRVPAKVARTTFWSRSRYHRRMKRDDSVLVACWTTRTPMVTTKPSRPTMAPTRTLSTPVAVEGEYRQAAGSETLWSSQMVSCPSSGPSSAPRIGRAYRLPLNCWRTRKTIPHDIAAPSRASMPRTARPGITRSG